MLLYINPKRKIRELLQKKLLVEIGFIMEIFIYSSDLLAKISRSVILLIENKVFIVI